jgi:hypothetical protein
MEEVPNRAGLRNLSPTPCKDEKLKVRQKQLITESNRKNLILAWLIAAAASL